ncbi:hypothetical protein HWV62_35925 [Athelia sp. TMB]|nr:hypothetical protein HWV62_35925 [Athelia sp. TMB]
MVTTRADNANKHPGLVVANPPRRTPQEAAQERLAKQEKKDASLAAKAAKAQRLQSLTEEASTKDASYSTPPATNGKKRKGHPLTRTESVNLEDMFAMEADQMDDTMPPPPPPGIQSKRKPSKADKNTPSQTDAAPVKRSTNSVPFKSKVRDSTIPSGGQKKRTVADPETDSAAPIERITSQPDSVQVKPTESLAKSKTHSGDVPITLPVGSRGQPIGYRPRPRKETPAASENGLASGDLMDVDVQPPAPVRALAPPPARNTTAPPARATAIPPARAAGAPSAGKKATTTSTQTASRRDARVSSSHSTAAPKDNSATEESSATEDDSQAPVYVPKPVFKTEESERAPPMKKVKVGQPERNVGKGGKRSKGRVISETESSEVEVSEGVGFRAPKVEEPSVKKRGTGGEQSSHQKSAKDKIKGAGVSNEYSKPDFSGTNNVEAWTATIPRSFKASSARTTSTPSLTNTRTGSQATTATRPPASVASRSSALNNGIKISEDDEEDYINETGAISDHDETKGEEYEAKKSSPLKDGRRLTSAHKVKVEPGVVALPHRGKSSTKKLPEHLQEGTIWKQKVVPSMILYAATEARIFRIPLKKVAQVFGVVCRFHYDDDSIEFQAEDPVVAKIMQRLADQFRSPIGSAAISVLLAYLASNPELKDSDEQRAMWCEGMLQDFRFIYARWKRPFQSGLIIQTFAAYISAIKNVRWLDGMYPGSDDPNVLKPEPRPALALVTAAVERALQFVADGRITLATIEASGAKKGGYLITADVNPNTKRRSPASVAFSEELWGDTVDDYLKSISKLRRSDMDKIITEARKFSRITRNHEDDEEPMQRGAKSSPANIPLNYDEDDDDDSEGSIVSTHRQC